MLQVNQQSPQQAPAAPTQTAPTQTAPAAYSNEAQMQPQVPNGIVTVTVNLDAESYKILQEASAVHSESIVNFGIKLFAKTNAYKEFMLKPEYKQSDTSTSDLSSDVDVSGAVNQVNTSSTTPSATATSTASAASVASAPTAAKSTGFASW